MRVTHHFVFVLVPPGRIRGSNNLCVCEETEAIARGRSQRGERRGESATKSSARGEERDLTFSPSVCAPGESRVRCVCFPAGTLVGLNVGVFIWFLFPVSRVLSAFSHPPLDFFSL